MTTALWGCTPNFWSLRTGVEGGEVEGSVEATLVWSDGCDDLTVFAINEEESVLLTFEMDGPLSEMHTDKKRLETLILSEDDDFSITLHTGQNLYSRSCYNEYYGYYDYYYEDEDREEEDYLDAGGRVFRYESGAVRMHLTAKKRRWDYDYDPVHVKLLLEDITLAEPGTGEKVTVPGVMIQSYIHQSYWYY